MKEKIIKKVLEKAKDYAKEYGFDAEFSLLKVEGYMLEALQKQEDALTEWRNRSMKIAVKEREDEILKIIDEWKNNQDLTIELHKSLPRYSISSKNIEDLKQKIKQ